MLDQVAETIERLSLMQCTAIAKVVSGVATLVELELCHSLSRGALYAFVNWRRNKIKRQSWEHNGSVLYHKALVKEHFKWPEPDDDLINLCGE